MPVLIGLLRAVNLGGRNAMRMEALRAVCDRLGFEDSVTYVQSGNVVFRTNESARTAAALLERAIEQEFGFRTPVIARTLPQMRKIVEANPFPMETRDPAKLLVLFLSGTAPREAATPTVATPAREEIRVAGQEAYIYFPAGLGRSNVAASLEKQLGPGTGRNWRTVTKLLELAERNNGQTKAV